MQHLVSRSPLRKAKRPLLAEHHCSAHSPLHDAAILYALEGRQVFPILPGEKRPLTEHGWHDASDDLAQIDRWWTMAPDANIAFNPHSVDLCIIDIDGPEGEAAFEKLEAEHGKLPETYEVRTPRGGRHLYFKGELPMTAWRPGVKRALGEHIDTRGVGSYVLLPPSRTKDGTYTILHDRPMADIPGWVGQLLKKPEPTAAPADVRLDLPGNVESARKLLADYVRKGHVAIEGQGGDNFTFQMAAKLRDMGLSEAKAFEVMAPWNAACVPPWGDDDLQAKIANAYSYGQNEAGAFAVRPASEAFTLPKVESPATAPSNFLLGYDALMALADPAPLVRGFIAIGDHAELRGYLKSAKTFIALDIALSIAAGVPALGHIETCEQGPVVYLAGEGFHVIKPRVRAWCQARGVSPDKLRGTFFCKPAVPYSGGGVEECERFISGIRQSLGRDPVLIVLDTMSNSLGSEDENSPAAANLYSEMVKKLRHDLGCTALTVAHTGKDAERGTRGTSAFEANADAILESTYDKENRTAEFKFVNGRLGGEFTANYYRLTNIPEAGNQDYTPAVLFRIDKPVEAKKSEVDKWKPLRRDIIEVLRNGGHVDKHDYLTTGMLADHLASLAFPGQREPRETDEQAHEAWEKARNDRVQMLKNGPSRGHFDGLWQDFPVPGARANQRRWFLPPELLDMDNLENA